MDTLSATTTDTLSIPSHPMQGGPPPPATATATKTTTAAASASPPPSSRQPPKRKSLSGSSDDKPHAKQRKEIHEVSATQCTNCGTTTTPLWRRAPNGDTICNACGLYLKARNQFRPPTLKRNSRRESTEQGSMPMTMTTSAPAATPIHDCGSGPESGTCPGGGQCNGSGGSESCAGCPAFNQHQVNRQTLICANCRTTTTPLWRRDESGNTICNACGLYYKLHGMHRPVSMKRSVIKRRKRVVVAETASSPSEAAEDEEQRQQHKQDDPSASASPKSQVIVRKQPKKSKASPSSKHHRPSPSSSASSPSTKAHIDEVPAIEDYIVPRRAPTPTPSPPPLVAPRPRLPQPSSGIESLLLAAQVDVQNNNNTTTLLPPISLPPLASALSEFDDTLDRLARLRRQPSSHHALQQIAPQLRDLVRRAEALSLQQHLPHHHHHRVSSSSPTTSTAPL